MVSNGSKTYTVDFKKHKLLSEMDLLTARTSWRPTPSRTPSPI